MIVVSNATPLIALAKIDQLLLLQSLFNTIHIPQAVYEEVVTKAPHRSGATEIRQASWIHTQIPIDRTKIDYLRTDLDPGEAETIVLAEELTADLVLLDETKARLAAQFLGLNFMGTVGVLLLAKRMGYVTIIRPLLDELKANKFYLSDRVYQAVLKQAGE